MALLTFLAGLALALHEPDRRTIAVAGATRAYLIEGAAEGSGPVYIALHPRPADGAAMRWISGLSTVAADGGAVIYPDGIAGEWSPAGPDHAFVDALIHAHGEGRPVVLVGVSNGADMALAYAAARPARLSALVLVSGGAGPDVPAPAVIPPTLVMLGTADPDFQRYAAGAEDWRRAGGCTPTGRLGEGSMEIADHDCRGGGGAREIRFQDKGHVWPGATRSGPLSWPDAPRSGLDLMRAFLETRLQPVNDAAGATDDSP